MKKLFVFIAIAMFLITGCAGVMRTPNPVEAYQYGDEKKSCEALKIELEACRDKLTKLNQRRNTKIATNAALGVTGAIIFFPFLFLMDVSDVDVVEITAQQNRYKSLSKICVDKECDFEIEPIKELQTYTATAEPNPADGR